MVFPDLSAPEIKPQKNNSDVIPMGSIADRFLALILDFLIFSPLVSLLIAGLVRQTKTFFLLNASSQEGVVAMALIAGTVVFVVTFLQAVFLYYWQATPGQMFLQLRVVSYPHEQSRLTLNQCILRAFLWCTGFFLLAVPFLELASHPLRRAFHERASDTLVLTLKKEHDEGPHPLESRFISSWMRMSFLFLLLFLVLGFFKTYHGLQAGVYRETAVVAGGSCKEIKNSELSGVARLDAALSLYLLNEITSECLDKEAEVSLWGDPVNAQPLAYLAKFITSDGGEQEKYFEKICQDSTSSACALARYMREDGDKSELEYADAKLWTTRLLLSEEKFTGHDYPGSLKLIEELQKVPALKGALEKRYVRSVYALSEELSKPGITSGRMPASADSDSWIETFKERYEVP